MIEVIDLQLNDIFDKEIISKINITDDKNYFITSTDLISKLLSIELPIKNTRLSIINILSFLNYFDTVCDTNNISKVSSTILIEYFTRDKYKEYIELLDSNNILTTIPYEDGSFYQPKVKSKRFRLHNSYNRSELCLVVIDSNKLPEYNIEEDVVDLRFENTIKNIDFNYDAAIQDEIRNYKENNLDKDILRKRISRLLSLKVRRYINKGHNVDRIYHSLSNISKISRKHTTIKFNNIDVKNCQPLLLYGFLKQNGMMIDDNYKKDCEEGIVYENFIGELDRDKTKVEMYKSIYFGFDKKNVYNKKFKELYPNTWSSLEILSKEEKTIASLLQTFEASLFNNLTPTKSKNYFTIFDAIYFDNLVDASKLVKDIRDFFLKLDMKVALTLNEKKI